MSNTLFWILIATAAAALVYLLYRAYLSLRTYLEFRGQRLVNCPETHKTATVELDAKEAAREAFSHKPQMQLSQCTRWPERKDCGQDCLNQIEIAPSECLVRNIVINWFDDKKCIFCGKSIAEVKEWWVDHKPALLTPEKQIIVWNQFPAEKLPELFEKCEPVCWSCAATEDFRKTHPEMVTDRAATDLRIRYIK